MVRYMSEAIKVKRLSETSKLPTRAHSGDLGYDVYANEFKTIFRGQTELIRLGISVEPPKGWGFFFKDRSGISSKSNIFVHAGVIDNEYRGEYMVLLHNAGPHDYNVRRGEKIAQMVLIQIPDFKVIEVYELGSSERGDRGFGSTGS